MIRSKRRQEHQALITSIRNDNISEVSKWVRAHGIDHVITLETSDLVSKGKLVNATVLNIAIMVGSEVIAVWALRSGATHNVATLICKDASDPDAPMSEQEQHPLMAAVLVRMPKTVELLVDQQADAGYQQSFKVKRSGERKQRQAPIWQLIGSCPDCMKFCEVCGLHKLLRLVEDDNFMMYAPEWALVKPSAPLQASMH